MLRSDLAKEALMRVLWFSSFSVLLTLVLWAGCPAPSHDDDDDSATPGDDDTATECEQTYEGHQECEDELGFLGFCGDDGECIEASGCEAEDCCVPGQSGDEYCESSFGEGSVCAIVNDDGRCT